MRGGSGNSLASGGQLGGSQLGGRVNYALAHGLFLTSRVSSPLEANFGREGTIGIGYRHGSVGIIAEQRIGLDHGAKRRPSVTAYGGFSDFVLPARFRLDGYAQAGFVGHDGFGDGALRVKHMLTTIGRARLSGGGGVWGAFQPGVARVDVGPQIVVRVPVIGHVVRASAEWRQRIAGNASPGSGPAFTLGADF